MGGARQGRAEQGGAGQWQRSAGQGEADTGKNRTEIVNSSAGIVTKECLQMKII